MRREFPNPGHPPRKRGWKDAMLGIRWANGLESKHEFTASQLVWDLRGQDFDVGFFWKSSEINP